MTDEISHRAGAWILSLGKLVANDTSDKLARVAFEAIHLAYRGAGFYSAIRLLGTVSAKRLEAFRLVHELSKVELAFVLRELEAADQLEVHVGAKDDETALTIGPGTRESTYSVALNLFEAQDPADTARLAIGILDATVMLPIREADLIEKLLKAHGVAENVARTTISHLEVLSAIQRTIETADGEPLLYNPLFFQSSDTVIMAALSALSSTQRDEALQIVEHVRTKPAMPLPKSLRGATYEVLKKVGIVDVSAFTPKKGERPHEFPTLQSAWGNLALPDKSMAGADVVDDAKALLASMRYGQNFATYRGGRIRDPYVLVSRMIQRGSVGPASNIGTDYPLVARRGIVDIVENPAFPGRYMMELRKPEIATPVAAMLKEAADSDIDAADDVAPFELANPYRSPEEGRRNVLKGELRDAWESVIHESLRIRR